MNGAGEHRKEACAAVAKRRRRPAVHTAGSTKHWLLLVCPRPRAVLRSATRFQTGAKHCVLADNKHYETVWSLKGFPISRTESPMHPPVKSRRATLSRLLIEDHLRTVGQSAWQPARDTH